MARILLIDDEHMVRALLSQVLTKAGYEVTLAENGSAAYKLCLVSEFDLIITDIVMPEMDGLELIQEMQQCCPRTKIIAMSGGGRCSPLDYLEICRVWGVSATIAKPFTNKDLIALVGEVLAS